MTPDKINKAIAEWMNLRLFVIHKPIHDPFGYYRENAHGYTSNINEAWKVTAEVAAKYTTGPAYENEPDKVIAEPAPIPNFYKDLNACREAVNKLSELERVEFIKLIAARPSREWLPLIILEVVTDPELMSCYLLRTIGRWEEGE